MRNVYPFGSLANVELEVLSPGFAPQPFDWFAFIEDDDAAGSFAELLSPKTSVRNQKLGQGEEKLSWRAPAALTVEAG